MIAWGVIGLLTVGLPGSNVALAAGPAASLAVASDPEGAAVIVDGRLEGETPLSLASLEAGEHRVTLVKHGYLENSRLVTVLPGRPGSLAVSLTPGTARLRGQVDEEPSSARAETKSGSSTGKIALLALGAAAVGGAAYFLLTKNSAPTLGGVTAAPAIALMGATSVEFSAVDATDPDGDNLSYSWDFGDGGSATGATATHVFQQDGSFTVQLTVSDGSKDASATTVVTVRSLSGTWNVTSNLFSVTLNYQISHTGNQIQGTSLSNANGFTGTVSHPRRIDFAHAWAGCPSTPQHFEGNAEEDLNAFDVIGPGCSSSLIYQLYFRR